MRLNPVSLTTRLAKLEGALKPDDYRALLIVLEEEDGSWRANGVEIDKTLIDPKTQIVVLSRRSDGPQ